MKPKFSAVLAPIIVFASLAFAGRAGAADTPAGGGQTKDVAANRVVLWNGKDLTGWKIFLGDATVNPQSAWSAADGVLHLATKASGYAKTEKSFANYHLHVEWRWPKDAPANTNSG